MAPPTMIHFVWVGSPFVPTPAQAVVLASWRREFPDVQRRVWTDSAASTLLRKYPRVEGAYARLSPVQKADVLRYVVMLEHGGVYADLDYECLRRFEVPDAPAVVESNFFGAPTGVNNCLLSASRGGERFWALVVDRVAESAVPSTSTLDVIASTGPGFLGERVAEFRGAGGRVDVFPRALFNPCDDLCGRCADVDAAYGRHVSEFSWGTKPMHRVKRVACSRGMYPVTKRLVPAASRAGAAATTAVVVVAAAAVVAVFWAKNQLKSPGRS